MTLMLKFILVKWYYNAYSSMKSTPRTRILKCMKLSSNGGSQIAAKNERAL